MEQTNFIIYQNTNHLQHSIQHSYPSWWDGFNGIGYVILIIGLILVVLLFSYLYARSKLIDRDVKNIVSNGTIKNNQPVLQGVEVSTNDNVKIRQDIWNSFIKKYNVEINNQGILSRYKVDWKDTQYNITGNVFKIKDKTNNDVVNAVFLFNLPDAFYLKDNSKERNLAFKEILLHPAPNSNEKAYLIFTPTKSARIYNVFGYEPMISKKVPPKQFSNNGILSINDLRTIFMDEKIEIKTLNEGVVLFSLINGNETIEVTSDLQYLFNQYNTNDEIKTMLYWDTKNSTLYTYTKSIVKLDDDEIEPYIKDSKTDLILDKMFFRKTDETNALRMKQNG